MLLLVYVAIVAISTNLFAQNCPENIGFENGNFRNWKLFTGLTTLYSNKNVISTNEVNAPSLGRHTIVTNKAEKDYYGGFEAIPKNGGNFSVKLGNNGTGAQVDGISYLLSVPSDRPEFTLTYQYAVVLEDPSHPLEEQPRFIARVKDLEKNEYIPCASFEYVATSSLPGFKKSKMNGTVIYKEWTPVTINLSGYQGKQLLIEFISADCALGGHFGYAYVDVNNLCGNLIVGNTFCKSADELNISGPSGFQYYNWYNGDKTVKYGSGQAINIKPTPPEGSKIILDLVPYAGFGCPSSITSVVHSVDYQLQVSEKNTVCQNTEIDLTSSNYILNKNDEFTYLVYHDKDLTQQLNGLVKVQKDATYYIKATNYKGCESIAPINILIFDLAKIAIQNPINVCFNETVDITNSLLYSNLDEITRSYFLDKQATKPLLNPNAIKTSGTYYVMLANEYGCNKLVPIEAIISPKPLLNISNPVAVCYPNTVDITAANVFAGNDGSFKYKFFKDATLTIPIANPKNIDKTGSYYVTASNAQGCSINGEINVVVNDSPVLTIKNPAAVCYPEKVDLTNPDIYVGSSEKLSYSFFSDESLTDKLSNPKAVGKSGTYYVKATNSSGCYVSDKINVTINSLPTILLNKPKAIFDYDSIDLTSSEITNRSKDFVKVNYFYDASLSRPIVDPTKISKAGTYYISLQNEKGCSVSAPIELNILPSPKIVVPTAFTPHKETNNKLYPFLVSIQKLTSFKVFNKWGILVYQTDLATNGWDGQFKSKMQPLETFSWFAEGIDTFGGKFQTTGKTILIL